MQPSGRRRRHVDDVKMNAAASGAAHGPVFGAGLRGDDAQEREFGVAVRAIRRRLRGGAVGRIGSAQRHGLGHRFAG